MKTLNEMNIGDIKNRLKLANNSLPVYFDFCECVPTTIDSWRGNYEEPAIGWAASGYSGKGEAPTAQQFLDELKLATSGISYQGWHGGEYVYTDEAQLYVDNPGDCTRTKIIAIEILNDRVILHTDCNRFEQD